MTDKTGVPDAYVAEAPAKKAAGAGAGAPPVSLVHSIQDVPPPPPPSSSPRDVAWTVLFLANTATFFVLAGQAAGRALHHHGHAEHWGGTRPGQVALLLGAFVGLSLLLGSLFTAAAFRWPRATFNVSAGFLIGYTAVAIYFLAVAGQVAGVVIASLFVLVECWTIYNFRRFAAFAEQLVGAVREVVGLRAGLSRVAVASGILLVAYVMLVWLLGLALVFRGPAACPTAVLAVWAIFTFYWTTEVVKNVVHVTVAGTVADWYFNGTETASPTARSFYRASTLSLGSVVLGSLIVAVLQTLRRVLQLMRARGSRNLAVMVLSCIATVLLAVIEAILRVFNKFVFTVVAVTGETYCEAAKRTKELFGAHGFELVMTNNIVVNIVSASALATACTVGVAGVGLVRAMHVADGSPWVAFAVGAVVAVFIVDGLFVLLDAGSCAVLVCYLMAPSTLQVRRPDLYASLQAAERLIRARASPA